MTFSHQLLNHKVERKQNTFNRVMNTVKGKIKEFFLLPWQDSCVKKLGDAKFWIINAPMGAGKTIVMLALAWYKLRKDPQLRIIISGPQMIICKGYVTAMKIFLSQFDFFEHFVNWDLSDESENKSDVVLNFLTRINSGSVPDRFLVCPHSTLVIAFYDEHGNPRPEFCNVLIVLDEAHHSEYGENEEHKIETNKLGGIVRYAIENQNLNHLQIGLSTATPFRGNRTPMVFKSVKGLFIPFQLSWAEFFDTTNIESFTHDFVLYTDQFSEPIEKIFRKSLQPTICFIPSVNSVAASESKHDDVQLFYEAIAGCKNPQIRNPNGPVTEVYSTIEKRWLKGVNLVAEVNRTKKKDAIIADDDADERGLDFIVALQMFIEGANWRWATREIIIGQRLSFTQYIQMMGRLFRNTPTSVKILEFFHLLQYSLVEPDEETLRTACNIRLNAVIYLMLAVDIMFPAPIKLHDNKPVDDGDDTLDEDFGDDAPTVAMTIMKEAMRVVNAQGKPVDRNQLCGIVRNILVQRGEDLSHTEAIVDRIIHAENLINQRIEKEPDGISLENITLNLVDSGGILADGPLIHFVTDGMGAHTWKTCFEALGTVWDENFKKVQTGDWKLILQDRQHQLNRWLYEQRREYDYGASLKESQRIALESLPGWKNQVRGKARRRLDAYTDTAAQ